MLKKIIIGVIVIIILSFAGCKYIVKGSVGVLKSALIDNCDTKNDAVQCLSLAMFHANDSMSLAGFEKDFKKVEYYRNKAEELAHKKCDMNNINQCAVLFNVYLFKDDIQKAKAILPKLCIAGGHRVDDETLIFIKNICKPDTIQRYQQINKQDTLAKRHFLLGLEDE